MTSNTSSKLSEYGGEGNIKQHSATVLLVLDLPFLDIRPKLASTCLKPTEATSQAIAAPTPVVVEEEAEAVMEE